jgi:tetratricopeptide (TPR) repeat protein
MPSQADRSALSDAPVLGSEPLAKGVYVPIDRRDPLNGPALRRALMPRQEICTALAAASETSTQPAATPAPSGDALASDAPPEAVKYYLQGRQHFLEDANSQAMADLEKSLQVDPNAFTVLRLMGRVCFAGSQLARGATYLERAHALRPNDVEVNYLLGRYWLERNDADKACSFLFQAVDSPERQLTTTFAPLATFYLGVALQLGGYHLAAVHEYERFLELAEMPVPGYRYDAEMSFLMNMQWAVQLAIAENALRLGDYHSALDHYRAAGTGRPSDIFISSRLVNALVHDGQMDAAQQAALALVTITKGSDDSVKLLAWVYAAAGRQANLVADLRTYLAAGSPGQSFEKQAATTLSAAQEALGQKLDALRTLAEFLHRNPNDQDTLARLFTHVDSADGFALALSAAADAIAADRDNYLPVLRLVVPVAEGPVGDKYLKAHSARALVSSSAKNGAQFALDYLLAVTRQAQNQPFDIVAEAYEASLQSNRDFFPAAEAYATYLLSQERFAKATTVIDAFMRNNADSAPARRLEIESEVAQQRYAHAVELAQSAIAKFPDDADLRIQRASIHRLRGQDNKADAELISLIDDQPKYESAYRALINSLLLRMRQPGFDANANQALMVSTLQKMSTALPNSRFGRIATAILYARSRRYAEAEALLGSVLTQEPDDPEALIPLAQIEDLRDRPAIGITLLENALRRKAQPDVIRALATLYRNQNRKDDALALARRFADENPDSETYALVYVAELTAQEKRSEALAYLRQTASRFAHSERVTMLLARMQADAGDQESAMTTLHNFMQAHGETTERLYLLAQFCALAGNEDASAAALQRLLAIMPDHVSANNDLGYIWANAGIHLEQAEPMIRKALENRPNDPSFLDSLGWLCYKQGKFDQAAALLEKALSLGTSSSPEILRHLGDTLYRLDRHTDAVTQWAKALELHALSTRPSPDGRREQDYLTSVLAEVRAGRAAAVSPLAEPTPATSTGSAAISTTQPQN